VDALELAIDGSETHVGHFVSRERWQKRVTNFAAAASRLCSAEPPSISISHRLSGPGAVPAPRHGLRTSRHFPASLTRSALDRPPGHPCTRALTSSFRPGLLATASSPGGTPESPCPARCIGWPPHRSRLPHLCHNSGTPADARSLNRRTEPELFVFSRRLAARTRRKRTPARRLHPAARPQTPLLLVTL